ncbi:MULTISPECIES: hypothetical protein [Nocardioides]|uniref:Uncharacterized protein n=1 Tax=Nocardioides vastitatis TaxID=2568655 RepID=A0ABW0ZI90_9ACTN|nr:hypothetical protein [Nocardioides sp.]
MGEEELDTYSEESKVLFVVSAVLLSLVVAGLVVVYVAYPHRGEKVPYAPWLGEAMGKAVDATPVIEDGELDLQREAQRSR